MRTAAKIALDESLRRSWTVYLLLSIILLPGAVFCVINLFLLISHMLEWREFFGLVLLAEFLFSLVVICIFVSFVRSAREAKRRLKQLELDPSSKVRPMPVSFLESFFQLRH